MQIIILRNSLWLLLSLPVLLVQAATIKAGSTERYKTIQLAVDGAVPFDTVLLSGETFFETMIRINKPIYLIGQENTVIDGEGKDELLVIAADSVTVLDVTFKNVGYSFIKDRSGIRVEEKDYALIENCTLINTFFGIYLQKSRHSIVRNNRITGVSGSTETYTGNAIHLWYCDSILIENNIVRNHRDGIYLEFVNHSQIIGNESRNNIRYGLHFMFSNHDEYYRNQFIDNGSGVAVMFSKWISMRDNTFKKNWGASSYGLLLKEIYDGTIVHNVFDDNTVAVHAEGANRIRIENNVLKNNGWALKVMGSCFDNKIVANNFLNNNFNVSTNSRKSHDKYLNNYWDDYTGYDLDRDGKGDIPHRPVKLFAYVVERVPISIITMRSLFIGMIDVAEYIVPSLTPENLTDPMPAMQPYVL